MKRVEFTYKVKPIFTNDDFVDPEPLVSWELTDVEDLVPFHKGFMDVDQEPLWDRRDPVQLI